MNYSGYASIHARHIPDKVCLIERTPAAGERRTFTWKQFNDEINRTVFRAVKGFEIDDERLGANVIAKVGPGGNFVAEDHTLKYLRGERYVPSLLYRDSREAWEASGSKTFVERAKEKALSILEEHQPNLLPEDISKELDQLVAKVLQSLKK